jgi:sulfhydrogenase subunit beta (sulfur reductase)
LRRFGGGDVTRFDEVTDANRDRIEMHLPNPYYPPKRFVLPHLERLLLIRGNGELSIEPVDESRPLALFGIRSCDVAGIAHLDRFYLGRQYRDVYYEQRRKELFLVNVVCTDPEQDIDSVCFCVCADTGPAARDHFDLQLMDLGDEFLVVAGSPAGEACLPSRSSDPPPPRTLNVDASCWRGAQTFQDHDELVSRDRAHVSQGAVLGPHLVGDWQSLPRMRRLHLCLPGVHLFHGIRSRVGEHEIERVRLWDSCALDGFTRMAGGFNPRRAVHDRRNRRFFRKLAHYFIQRELSMACVGAAVWSMCGGVPTGMFGMPSVVRDDPAGVVGAGGSGAVMTMDQTENIYLPKLAVLDRVVEEIAEVRTFFWHFLDPEDQRAFKRFRPGQFAQVSLFGIGEFPASLPPSPTEDETFFTIRQVGSCTAALHQLRPGHQFGVRGPYGNGFPMERMRGRTWCLWREELA